MRVICQLQPDAMPTAFTEGGMPHWDRVPSKDELVWMSGRLWAVDKVVHEYNPAEARAEAIVYVVPAPMQYNPVLRGGL